MKIVDNTNARLILKGKPGGIRWMSFAAVLGLTVMGLTGFFGWTLVTELKSYLPLIPLGFGFLMGLGFFALGMISLALGRMTLTFHRASGEAHYDVYSPIIDVGKPCSFRIDAIDSVTIDRFEGERPSGPESGSFPAKVCRSRLKLTKPRRIIILDETENGREARVQATATAVAEWLGTEVIHSR